MIPWLSNFQASEDRGQRSEVRRQMSENRWKNCKMEQPICPLSSVFCFLSSVLCHLFKGPILNFSSSISGFPSAAFNLMIISFFKNCNWWIQVELLTCTTRSLPLKAAGRAFCAMVSPTASSHRRHTSFSSKSGLDRYGSKTSSRMFRIWTKSERLSEFFICEEL